MADAYIVVNQIVQCETGFEDGLIFIKNDKKLFFDFLESLVLGVENLIQFV